ncbi:MAG: DUF58 domain-containing protein [Nitrospinota bacterium]|nr:MAG: DUF58 domain-containing protein [Nitrospinota bacterium]
MQPVPSPRLYWYSVLGGGALTLGVVLQRVELVLVAVPFLLSLLWYVLLDTPPAYRLTYHCDTVRAFEGDTVTRRLTLQALTPLPLLEILDPLPPQVRLRRGVHHLVLSLEAGEQVTLFTALHCMRRGDLTLGRVRLRVLGRSGMLWYEAEEQTRYHCRVYPALHPLRRTPLPRHTQVHVGNYISRRVGEGIEFGSIRPYSPGDPMRRIHWRLSRKWQELYVREFQQERNADVVLLLDCLRNTGNLEDNTLDHSIRAAASLAASFLRRKDRVGLISYGGTFSWVRPELGQQQLYRILDHLVTISVHWSYVSKDITRVPRRILPPQALILALTPLLDDRFIVTLNDLLARGFDVTVLYLSPVAVLQRLLPADAVTDVACRLWALEQRVKLHHLRTLGMRVIPWDGEQPLEICFARRRGKRRERMA